MEERLGGDVADDSEATYITYKPESSCTGG